jgi:phosphoribosylamine--glycine ligase
MNVLILGSGGREHTLAWKIAQSEKTDKVFIAPGNAGTPSVGINTDLNPLDFNQVKEFVISNSIDMVVVGPEDPLVKGIVDFFKEDNQLKNVCIVGPQKDGAILEGSKDFAKEFMFKNNIPTAKYQTFTLNQFDDAVAFMNQLNPPYVLKADGLAAGKGVLIIDDIDEAKASLKEMLNGKFGESSAKVVIEEFLKGIEVSYFVLTDGKNFVLLPEAKDYKRIGEGDTGLNTGGMGAVSPVPFADSEFTEKVIERIVKPTINGFANDNIDYRGFVFIGLMNVNGDPYVIEYNVRMGDPETEAVIPRIKSDFAEALYSLKDQTLDKVTFEIDNRTATTVMLVSGGYPESYEKGHLISNIDNITDSVLFHAGTKEVDNNVVTNGGRVMAITSFGNDITEAVDKSLKNAEAINFNKKYYRTDIGKDLL